MTHDNDFSKLMSDLTDVLRNDPEYAWSWHCNLWAAAYDSGANSEQATRTAERFMDNWFGFHAHSPKEIQLDRLESPLL